MRERDVRTRKLKLGRPDLSAQIEQRYRQEKDSRHMVRLLCMKLAASGERSAAEIAEICGCSRASVFEWIKAFREGGFESLCRGKSPVPRQENCAGWPKKSAASFEKASRAEGGQQRRLHGSGLRGNMGWKSPISRSGNG